VDYEGVLYRTADADKPVHRQGYKLVRRTMGHNFTPKVDGDPSANQWTYTASAYQALPPRVDLAGAADPHTDRLISDGYGPQGC
jgi:hypothetical protein